MSKITPITTTVIGDEKAWLYQEVHLQSPQNRGFHRYRRILVNRGGNIAEYSEDMGLVKDFKGVKQINIPSVWEHTVDELLDLADYLRNTTDIDLKDWLELESFNAA